MIGIDLVKIDRISRFRKRFGEAGLARFLTPNEILQRVSDQQIAAAWAVKEAVSKALGCGIGAKLSFHDIEIVKSAGGTPTATLSPKAQKIHGVKSLKISISHEKEYAVAVAIVDI